MFPFAQNLMLPARVGLVEEARDNLGEAVELFLESASDEEVSERLSTEVFVTSIEVALGKVA